MKDLVNFPSEGEKCECLLERGAESCIAAAVAAAAASTCVKGGTEICRTNWTLSAQPAKAPRMV